MSTWSYGLPSPALSICYSPLHDVIDFAHLSSHGPVCRPFVSLYYMPIIQSAG